MLTPTCNSIIWEAEAEGWRVWGQLGLHSEFHTSLSHIAKTVSIPLHQPELHSKNCLNTPPQKFSGHICIIFSWSPHVICDFSKLYHLPLSPEITLISLFPHRFICFWGTGVWTQGLHLEPLHQPFFEMVFLEIGSLELFARLASNHNPPDLCLLSS
jgi:hypothetical protein